MPRGGRAGRAVIAGPFPYQGRGRGEPEAPLPPPPPINPPATEIGVVLTNLGFPLDITEYFAAEGVTLLSHFLILHKDGIDKLFSRMDTAHVPYTAIQFSLIKSLHHYVRRMYTINMPINPILITLELLANENQTVEETRSTSSTNKSNLTFPPSFKDHSKWRTFRDLFINYLHSIKGSRNVSLAYIVRPDTIPQGTDPLDPLYTIELHGPHYIQDRSEVYTILERCVIQGPGETYVKEHQSTRNGRIAFLELDRRFGGDAVTSTKIGNAWKTINSTKYNGKRKNFDFTTYKSVLDEAFRDLQESGLNQPDETKIYFLLNGIENDQLKRVKDGVVTNPLMCKNYHEATLYIARCIAHDNSVDTESKMSRSIMATGTSLSARTYSPEEWKNLTVDERHAVFRMREHNQSMGRGRGRSTNDTRAPGRGFVRGGRYHGRGRGRGRIVRFQLPNRLNSSNVDGRISTATALTTTNGIRRQVAKVDVADGFYGNYYGPFPDDHIVNNTTDYDASDPGEVIEPRSKPELFQPTKIRRISTMRVRHVSYSRSINEEGGRCELDSHADNCLLGSNAVVLEEYIGDKFHVYGYKKDSGFTVLNTVKGALAYDLEGGQVLILVFDQVFYDGSLPNSLLNPNQMRENGVIVEDTPLRYGGKSHTIQIDGFTIQLKSKGYISYFPGRKPTKDEMEHCPHINMTGPKWNPHSDEFEEIEDTLNHTRDISVLSLRVDGVEPAILAKRLMISRESVEKTLKATTIYAVRDFAEGRYSGYGHRFRWLGRRQISGRFWTDTFFGQKSKSGNTCAQIFINEFRYIFVVPMQGRREAPYALRSFFDSVGLPELIISDNAREQRSQEWKSVMREFGVLERGVESYKSHQNYAENGVMVVKFKVAKIMEQAGVPGPLWDHTLLYASLLSNRTVTGNPRLEGRTPHEYIFGHTPDISALITFTFYDHVWYYDPIHRFPEPRRLVGRWLGPSKTLATDLVYKVLTISGNVIHTSGVEPISPSDKDQTSVIHTIKEFDVKMHNLMPFVSIDIAELFEIDDMRGIDIENLDNVSQLQLSGTEDTLDRRITDTEDIVKRITDTEDIVNQRISGTEDTLDRRITDTEDIVKRITGTEDTKYRSSSTEDTIENEEQVHRIPCRARRAGTEDTNAISIASVKGWESARVVNEGRQGTVKHRKRNAEGDEIYEIEYDDRSKGFMAADAIATSIYSSVDNDGFTWLCLDTIVDHFESKKISPKSHKLKSTDGWFFLVRWKDGRQDVVRLKDIKESYPVEVASYAKSMNIDINPAFSWWTPYTLKKSERIINKVTARNVKRFEKFGITLPRSVAEAMELDRRSGTTYWHDAIQKEMKNVSIAFKILERGDKAPIGYQRITCHLIFDVKIDGTRKARYVAGGHLTEVPSSITYSSVVARDSIRILLLLSALNGLKILACDIQNAYLNAPIREKVFFIAGTEFGENCGCVVVLVRALYGLKSSGAAFRSTLAQDLRELGYCASQADPDVWMKARSKPNGDSYWEYLLVYVDDILCISDSPEEFMVKFERIYKLKDGFHIPKSFLGIDISTFHLQDHRGIQRICWGFSCDSYVKRIIQELEIRLEKENLKLPTHAVTPLSPAYHPEVDSSENLSEDYHEWYQSLIGTLRWMVEIGRIDLSHAVSIMSTYLSCPRIGHLYEVLHIYGYLKRFMVASLVLNPGDMVSTKSTPSVIREDWFDFYPEAKEDIPINTPKPRGLSVNITAYVDANHAGNLLTRRSHTGIVIFVQNSPIIWFSKAQKTVETSTHGAELVATRICVELVESLRYKLRMFGVQVDGPATILCDNQSVVHNGQRPESTLKKKHTAVSYHKIREAVAAGIIVIHKIDSEMNVADLLTKCLSGVKTKFHVQNILYCEE